MNQHRIRVTRRGVQVSLGLLWILDGLLQLQPAMLTARFATEAIVPAGQGQPTFVSWPIQRTAHLIGYQPVLADLAFALIQLAIGPACCTRGPLGERWPGRSSGRWRSGTWAKASAACSAAGPVCSPEHPGRPWSTRWCP